MCLLICSASNKLNASFNIVEDINTALKLRKKNTFEHKRKILNELENQVNNR